MRKTVILIFLLASFFLQAQKSWLISDNIENGIKVKPKLVVNLIDDDSGHFVSFFKSKKTARAQLFDENQKLISTIDLENNVIGNYKYFGSSTTALNYTMLFQKYNSKLAFLKLDFKTNNYEFIEVLDTEFNDEQIIESFNYNGELFILSILKNESKLNLYNLNIDGSINLKKIDFSNETFVKRNGLKTSLYHLITNKNKPSVTNSAVVEYNAPISLEIGSAINKVYFNDGVITITNDNNVNQTYIIVIDIKNDKYSCKSIFKKGFVKKELRSESNSFIMDNYFFSNYVTTSKMVFAIHDLKSGLLVKEFIINNKDIIKFKNTEFIESRDGKSNSFDYPTRRFLKKVVNSNLGLSVRKEERGYVISIGASEKVTEAHFAAIGFIIGGIPVSAILSAFDTYSSSRSTKIDCLFDNDFNHIEGDIKPNKFDSINEFKRENKFKKMPLQSIFKYKDQYIWGFYSKQTGLYRYYSF